MTQSAPKRASVRSVGNNIRTSGQDPAGGVLLPRRRFLRLAAGATSGAAAWLATGCFGDDDDGPQTATADVTVSGTPAATGSPKRGGTLRTSQPVDLALTAGHPFALAAQNRILAYGAHETLVQYNDSLTPTPLLAERFEVTPDRRRVIVTLKPGLEFHDGAPVTADDVAFSVEAVRDPSSAGIPPTAPLELSAFARTVTDIRVADPRTVEFTLDRPQVNITDFFAQLHIAQRASFPDIARGEVIGTGPFRLSDWDQGRSYRLERFDNWHGATGSGGPYLDAIEVAILTDPAAAAAQLRTGGLDAYIAVSAPDAKPLLGTARERIAVKTGMNYLGVNVTNPMLQDPRVRRAIFYALDRDRLFRDAGQGLNNVTSQPWAPTSPAFDPALDNQPFYDPARAAALLQQAGFQQDRPLIIEYTAASALQLLQAQIIQDNLKAIDMDIQLQAVEPGTYTARYRNREFPDFWLAGTLAGDLTPLTMFQLTFEFRPAGNASRFEDPVYADLVARLADLDPHGPEANDVYRQLNELMIENPFVIPTGIPQARIDLVKDNVAGWPEKPGDYAISLAGKIDFSKVWLR